MRGRSKQRPYSADENKGGVHRTPPKVHIYRALLVHSKTLFKAVNPAAAVNQFLGSGKEWVALGANFHANIFFSGSCVNLEPTRATNSRGLVVGMYSLSHLYFTSLAG